MDTQIETLRRALQQALNALEKSAPFEQKAIANAREAFVKCGLANDGGPLK